MAYARGLGPFNCWITCRYQKITEKHFFSLVWNFDHENFSSSHLWYQAKNNPIFRYFPLSSRPSNYSVLKFGRYLILYIRRNETWQQLVTDWSMCEAGVLGSLWQFLSRRPQSVYLLFWANYQSLLTAFTAFTQSKNVPVELHVGYEEDIILSGSSSQKYLFGWCRWPNFFQFSVHVHPSHQ